MITSDCIFQRQSALFFFPMQWFKVQNNMRKWEKMEITLEGWLAAGMFYSKLVQNIFFNGRPTWEIMFHSVPQCQIGIGGITLIFPSIKGKMSTFWIGQIIFNSSLRLNTPFRQWKQLCWNIWWRLGTQDHLNNLFKVRVGVKCNFWTATWVTRNM